MHHVFLMIGVLGAASVFSATARADRVVLVGGTTIDGVATRKSGKVVVQVPSGEIALPADSVLRIEKSESAVSRFEARYAALRAGDVAARMELADYCRDHGMPAREQQLLREVLDIDANNAAARARLGYVKTNAGWTILRAGDLPQGAREMSRNDLLERSNAEARAAAEQRERAEAELRLRAAELEVRRAELDAQRRNEPLSPSSYYAYDAAFYVPFHGYGSSHRGFDACRKGRPCRPNPFRRARPAGAADSTSLSVVKVPYRNP